MTLCNYLPQRHWLPPYRIASMHASISKKHRRNAPGTPFGRPTHLPRLSAPFWSLKCQRNVMFLAMSLFCVIDALCNHALWCASLSPRKLHPVFHLKGGICVQKKDAQFPHVSG